MSAIARRRAAAATLSTAQQQPTNALQQQQQFQQQQQQQVSQNNRMLTLPEVIALVDSRLTNLEVTSQLQMQLLTTHSASSNSTTTTTPEDLEAMVANMLEPHLEEFNHRYEILATEILNIKNVLMKLQAYTLDVNKMLVDERIRVLSDPVLDDTADGKESAGTESVAEEAETQENVFMVTTTEEQDEQQQQEEEIVKEQEQEQKQEESEEVIPMATPAKKPRKKRNVISLSG